MSMFALYRLHYLRITDTSLYQTNELTPANMFTFPNLSLICFAVVSSQVLLHRHSTSHQIFFRHYMSPSYIAI